MRNIWAFAWGAVVGVLGGLIGLGGAEFRLPVLVSIFNYRTLQAIVVFLIFLSIILIGHNFIFSLGSLQLPIILKISFGFIAGIFIGIFSSMLGVAGGELIIPTIILLFAVDIKLAGSLSLASTKLKAGESLIIHSYHYIARFNRHISVSTCCQLQCLG